MCTDRTTNLVSPPTRRFFRQSRSPLFHSLHQVQSFGSADLHHPSGCGQNRSSFSSELWCRGSILYTRLLSEQDRPNKAEVPSPLRRSPDRLRLARYILAG